MLIKMDFEFFKYHGAGNDFIIIDNRKQVFPKENRKELIQNLCHRKFGIVSDVLILLDNDNEYDFYMDFYNPDGSQSFCGNGSRCVVMFAAHLGIIRKECTFRIIHGLNKEEIYDSINIQLQMFDVNEVEVTPDFQFMDTGSPHYNVFLDNVADLDLIPFAHTIRYNDRFKTDGTNVNVIQENDNGIIIRTYERGVEDETWACGTGATACALSYAILKGLKGNGEVNIQAKGGKLKVNYHSDDLKSFTNIYLIGPAEFVYKGEMDV
jgi:diaminopimelate epimerase